MSDDSTAPRIAPRPKPSWGDDVRTALEKGFPSAAPHFLSTAPDAIPVPNVLSTLMHHPALVGPFLAFNRVLLQTPTLEPRQRELMILRVAWRTRSPYEWVQHARLAVDLGVTVDEIDAIVRGNDTGAFSPLEADLLAATDQLMDDHCIEDDTWARLAARLDERQLIEVAFTVGTYSCLAMVFNSVGLQLDPGLEPPAGVRLPE